MSQRGYAGTAGAQVHYRISGDGPALVLLPPTPRSSAYYETLMSQLPDFTVVAVDTPGFGASDALDGDWTMFDVAERIASAVDELGLAQWNVLGVHTGNKIGAALCHARPEQVRRFLFAGMTHSIIVGNDQRNATMRAFYPSPEAVVVPGDPDPPSPEERLAYRWGYVGDNLAAIWGSYDPARAPGSPESEHRRRAVRSHAVDEVQGFEQFDRLYATNFALDLERLLSQMPVETVVMEMVVPAEDHLARQTDALLATIPKASAVTLTGTDRSLVSSDVARFATAIRAALDD